MARSRVKLAWTSLWAAFLIFCLLAVGIPWSINAYIASATAAQGASLQILRGTVFLQQKGTNVEINAASKQNGSDGAITLKEGDSLRTSEDAQAILWLFDGSNVRLWPNTSVSLVELQRTRYNNDRASLVLSQGNGHSRVEAAPLMTKTRRLEIETPESVLLLREGSFSINKNGTGTDIVVHNGSADVHGAQGAVELLKNERAHIKPGLLPSGPLAAVQNLVINGSFQGGLDGWQAANRGGEEPILGTAAAETDDGRNVLRFRRTGATKHDETYIFQGLNDDITDYESVKLSLDLKLINQSLSGGGIAGSEYPVMVRLKYKDVYGSDNYYVHGFYYHNEADNPTNNSELVPQNQWRTFEVDLLGPNSPVQPRPVYLLSLEVAASGHDYESMVTNISLMAQ